MSETVDAQVEASEDDTTCEVWNNYSTVNYIHFPYTGYMGFLRFPVDVPPEATIENGCYLKVYIYHADQTTGVVQLQQTDEDDAADFSLLPSARPVTGLTVNWEVPTGSQQDERISPEIKAIIQNKIDREDFDQGDHIAIRATRVSGGLNSIYQYDGSPTYAAKLHIEYSLPAAGGRGWWSK